MEDLRWVVGNGLGIFTDSSVADEYIELALDRRYGAARSQIVLNLPRTKDARVPGILMDLLDDPSVAAWAVEALGKMKWKAARGRVERLVESSDENVRAQAKKALKRMKDSPGNVN
jgi:HEAT repeat protein